MSISDSVKTVLEADVTLMALLTGGVYANGEITKQATAAAFDANGEIKPCALVNEGTELPIGPHIYGVQTAVVVYVYQREGFDVIEPASSRIYALLHYQKIGSKTWNVIYQSKIKNQRDIALDCPMIVSRYLAIQEREVS